MASSTRALSGSRNACQRPRLLAWQAVCHGERVVFAGIRPADDAAEAFPNGLEVRCADAAFCGCFFEPGGRERRASELGLEKLARKPNDDLAKLTPPRQRRSPCRRG